MSHKVAKAARRTVRAIGHDPREVALKSGEAITRNINWATLSYGQRVLMPNCGRSAYKGAKKLQHAAA